MTTLPARRRLPSTPVLLWAAAFALLTARAAAVVIAGLSAFVGLAALSPAAAQDTDMENEFARRYIFGAPADPDEAWVLAQGGRLYDTWWLVVGQSFPETTHSAYPEAGGQDGAATWRCVACHGWDYRGDEDTGIGGIDGVAGADPAKIVATIRDPAHGYTPAMIPDPAALWLARFVSAGQHDLDRAIDAKTDTVRGDPARGKRLFQNLCAICHDYDGRAEITGEAPWLRTIGAVALLSPAQALHKIRNGQPSADMPAMRAFDFQTTLDLLAYARTLPAEAKE